MRPLSNIVDKGPLPMNICLLQKFIDLNLLKQEDTDYNIVR